MNTLNQVSLLYRSLAIVALVPASVMLYVEGNGPIELLGTLFGGLGLGLMLAWLVAEWVTRRGHEE